MIFKTVIVACYDSIPNENIIGRWERPVFFKGENLSVCTYDDELTNSGENQFWILDKEGVNIILTFSDFKIRTISATHLFLVAYLNEDFNKKIKRGTKVEIYLSNL